MFFRDTSRGRPAIALAAALILAIAWTGAASGEEPEVVKGTVVNIRPSALYLSDIGSPDDDAPPRDAMFVIDENTEYFEAARKVTRDDIVPGLKVIVRSRNGGEGRTALQVRIIGGKVR